MKESEALEQVWRWKDAVCDETRGMTDEQVIAYFRAAPDRLAEKTGLRLKLPSPRPRKATSSSR